MTKTYTDGITVVQATCKAFAFDRLAEIYGHYDIGTITEVKK